MIFYGMTKTAQVAVARGLAESVAGTGVISELGSGGHDCQERQSETIISLKWAAIWVDWKPRHVSYELKGDHMNTIEIAKKLAELCK
jgi:hypothetical protein